ncbi:hypothetical protein RFI_39681, partial [Reticulomyxa filosa]
ICSFQNTAKSKKKFFFVLVSFATNTLCISQRFFDKPFVDFDTKKVQHFFILLNLKGVLEECLLFLMKNKHHNEYYCLCTSCYYKEEDIKLIIRHWIRILHIQFGWIHDFDKLVVNYVMLTYFLFFIQVAIKTFKYLLTPTVFMLDMFCSLSKLLNIFTEHTKDVWNIDYSTFDSNQFICSASSDKTVRVWNFENNKQIRLFNVSKHVYCAKFSPYHYHNYRQNVICFSTYSGLIDFWDFKDEQQLQRLSGYNI